MAKPYFDLSYPPSNNLEYFAVLLETLISNKTRIKLLLRFFLNPEAESYLRELEREFKETSNAIRIELNRFEDAGVIVSHRESNRKYYKANRTYPLFQDFQNLAMKHFGLDQIVEEVVQKLGHVHKVYLTGILAKGLNSPIIDLILIGEDIDRLYLSELIEKVEITIDRKIRCLVLKANEKELVPEPKVLLYER